MFNTTPQIFPGNLLQHNYADPSNPDRLLGHSEVKRRGVYFEQLENLLPRGNRHHLIQLIKGCLRNDPSQRLTSEQLVTALEEMKADIEGSYGVLAKVDAVRQVMTVKAFQQRKKENADELITKDQEIEHLQQQLQVRYVTKVCVSTMFIVSHLQAAEVELQQKDMEIQQKNVKRKSGISYHWLIIIVLCLLGRNR